jgi:arabinose-5-phosphate isomerase
MSDTAKALASAKSAIDIEISALNKFAQGIEGKLEGALNLITASKGRVIITGIGKSGLVGAKIAATLSSTGTAAYYIHSTDALHGDSGAILNEDVVIAISNSGETAEVVAVAQMVKGWGNKVIAITGKSDSALAKSADALIDISFEKEADPNGLAPTTSTTLTIAAGDALAAALITFKNFTSQDFGKRHPGGALGKKSNG